MACGKVELSGWCDQGEWVVMWGRSLLCGSRESGRSVVRGGAYEVDLVSDGQMGGHSGRGGVMVSLGHVRGGGGGRRCITDASATFCARGGGGEERRKRRGEEGGGGGGAPEAAPAPPPGWQLKNASTGLSEPPAVLLRVPAD